MTTTAARCMVRVKNKTKVIKLGDFVDRVRARVRDWEG